MNHATTIMPVNMDNESFDRLSTYVTREYGIKLPPSKKSMLEARLNKKIKTLGLRSYKEFLDFIFSDRGKREELYHVIDLITTNKTDFFRETYHFDFLTKEFLPHYTSRPGGNKLKIWSAGCSTGEEPYSIVMTMEEYRKQNAGIQYSVLASDVSFRVLQAAAQGVYDIRKLDPIPYDVKRAYFAKSIGNPEQARVKPQYRKKVRFRRVNLMDSQFGLLKADLDVIFCRNVLIYFDKITQESVINKLCSHLKAGGLLFLGHSESTIGLRVPLTQVRPTVYRFEG